MVSYLLSFVFLLAILTGNNYTSSMHEPWQSLSYLALGDSYTIGESVSEEERWPNQLTDLLNKKGIPVSRPRIIATTGWRTDNLKEAMKKAGLKNEYDIVSLLIGVNNQYQGKPASEYEEEFENLLTDAMALAKGNPKNVFVVSIPDYGYTPFGREKQKIISAQLDEFNAINKRIAEKHGVKYYNITDISRKGLEQPELVAADKLHPSGKMYRLWAERIASDFFR
jgi:lysophospholipase L1-like esterase